jgi:hypothetical protein
MTHTRVQIDNLVRKTHSLLNDWGDWPNYVGDCQLLGAGVSKGVYLLPDASQVLKVGAIDDEYNQIENEINTWLHAPKTLEIHLARIYEFGDNWIVSERADVLSQDEYQESPEVWELCSLLSEQWQIPDMLGNDGNIGRRVSDHTLCAIDYSGGFSRPYWEAWR